MGITACSAGDGFVQPTQLLLDDLGPGCFVQKKESNGDPYWVEITSINEGSYECIAHPSLIKDTDQEAVSEGDLDTVNRDQITAMGCERFCFCE